MAAPTSPARTTDPPDDPVAAFEGSLSELEDLVARMERGDLSLAETLAAFERGCTLARHCRDALAAAEQRVAVLVGETRVPLAGDAS